MVGVVKELGLVLAPFFFAAILKYSLSEAVIKHHMLILRLELMMTNCMRPSTDRNLQCLQCLRTMLGSILQIRRAVSKH